ncbi:hypothetical protein H7Y21_01695 [Arenimonas sp.]|nr:hypothetical protein [Candidatus Parcubacteria bacterium]
MKFILTFLGLANFAFAAPIPTTPIIEHLPIGGIAVAEALARAKSMEIFCASASRFYRKFDISAINSPDDIAALVSTVNVQVSVGDPKAEFLLQSNITAADGTQLFEAKNWLKLRKTGYDANGQSMYKPSDYAGNLYFVLTDFRLTIPGAETAEVIGLDGTVYQLNVYPGGLVEMQGWMNYGQMSELVINGNIRYDMNTGSRLKVQSATIPITSINFAGLQMAGFLNGVNVITTWPQYGTPDSFRVKSVSNRFKVRVESTEGWQWMKPVTIWVAQLKDLRSGGAGWKRVPYSDNMEITVPASGEYIVYPEYDANDIGGMILHSTPTTPVVIGGGGGRG